jgi:hypothetical protein
VEGVVIVGSILLAFGIDAWWDGVQQSAQRAELATALISDLETTKLRLAETTARADRVHTNARAFLRAAHASEQIPVDSLRFLAGDMITGLTFEPALGSYRGALGSGDLLAIQKPEIAAAFADFEEALRGFERREEMSSQVFYMGAIQELRMGIGSLDVLGLPGPRPGRDPVPGVFQLSDAQYRDLARSPAVYATIDARAILYALQLRALRNMDEAVGKLLELLLAED